MTCPNCQGLGSIVKANSSTGEFEIKECHCQNVKSLLNKTFHHSHTDCYTTILEVKELSLFSRFIWSGGLLNYGHHNRWIFEEAVSKGEEIEFQGELPAITAYECPAHGYTNSPDCRRCFPS